MTTEATTYEASSSEEGGDAAHRLDDSPVHGTTVNGLEESGIETAEDVVDIVDGSVSRRMARRRLSDLEGVGKTGAEQVLDWLGDTLDWSPGRESNSSTSYYNCLSCGEPLVEWPPTEEDDGLHECECGGLLDVRVEGPDYMAYSVDEIRCPHCGGLFDRVADDEPDYEPGMARCEDDLGEDADELGDCGRRFWLQSTEGSHETYKEPPEEAGDVEDEGDEEASESEENEAPPEREPEELEVSSESSESEDDSSGSFWPDESPEPPREAPEPPSVPPAERVHPDLPDCRQLGRAEVDSEAWHHIRSQGVGSSDVGAILGFSDHATAQDIWASKVDGEEADEKPWLKGFAQFGTWFEAYIREWCEAEHGATILPGRQLGTLRSVRWEKAVANIDGLDTSTGVIEEIKTTSEDWTSVPEDYCAQVQHQMYVTGAREARIRQFVCPVPRDLLPSLLEEFRGVCMVDEEADRALADWLLEHGTVETWIVERDEDFIERMVARERDFWEYVEQEVPPPEADPEGTVDLSDEPEVYANVRDLAEARARKEEVDDIIEHEDDAKKAAREAIEEAVALMDDEPKRVRIGPHKATLHEREHYSHWRIYEDTDEVSGAEWPDEGGQ